MFKFKACCEKCIGLQGMVSLVSQQGIHQLHIFIFVLAVVHVLCGVVTMVLGRAKVFSNFLDASCYPYHHLILGILVVHAVSNVFSCFFNDR